MERAREEAVPYVEKELTAEAWKEEFGDKGEVETPVGVVRLGAHQREKLEEKGRAGQFGLIKPTLTKPDFIIEESDAQEGAERQSKLLFIKTFTKGDGTKYTHFESVTVQQDGKEVVVSSHPIREKAMEKKLEKGEILWNRFGNGSDASGEHQVVDNQEAQDPSPADHGPKNPQSIPTGKDKPTLRTREASPAEIAFRESREKQLPQKTSRKKEAEGTKRAGTKAEPKNAPRPRRADESLLDYAELLAEKRQITKKK